MKTLNTVLAFLFGISIASAQNVGIGTLHPETPLHISGAGLQFAGLTLENSAIGGSADYAALLIFKSRQADAGHIKVASKPDGSTYFDLSLKGTRRLYVNSAGNVGINTNTPTHNLEVIGNVRISDSLGIGVSAPTTRLDINSGFRLRFGSGLGRTLVSDEQGNATWQQAVAFRTQGTVNAVVYPIPKYGWHKVMFNQVARYNYGAGYQAINSEFLVPYKGVYHFDAQTMFSSYITGYRGIRLQVRRGANIFTIAENDHFIADSEDGGYDRHTLPSQLGLDMQLEAGDFVYVEVSYGNNSPDQGITFEASKTWFTGHIVMRVP